MKNYILILFFLSLGNNILAEALIRGNVVKVEENKVTLKFNKPTELKISDTYYISDSKKITIQGVSENKKVAVGQFTGIAPKLGETVNLRLLNVRNQSPTRSILSNEVESLNKDELVQRLIKTSFILPRIEQKFIERFKVDVNRLGPESIHKAKIKYKKGELDLGLSKLILNEVSLDNVSRRFANRLLDIFQREELVLLVRIYEKPAISKLLRMINVKGTTSLYNNVGTSDKKDEILIRFLSEGVTPDEYLETMIYLAKVLDKIPLIYGVELENSLELLFRKELTSEDYEERIREHGITNISVSAYVSEKEAGEIKRIHESNQGILKKYFGARYQMLNELFGDIYQKLDKIAKQRKEYLKKQ